MNNFIYLFSKYYFCELEAVTIQYDYELASFGFIFLIIVPIINFLEFFMPYYALDISPVYVIQSLYVDMSLWDLNPIFIVENSNNINRIIYITYRELMLVIISNPETFNFLLGTNPLDLGYNELKPIVKIYIDAVNANVTALNNYYASFFALAPDIYALNQKAHGELKLYTSEIHGEIVYALVDVSQAIYMVDYPKFLEMILNSPNNIDINREVIESRHKEFISWMGDLKNHVDSSRKFCYYAQLALYILFIIGVVVYTGVNGRTGPPVNYV